MVPPQFDPFVLSIGSYIFLLRCIKYKHEVMNKENPFNNVALTLTNLGSLAFVYV